MAGSKSTNKLSLCPSLHKISHKLHKVAQGSIIDRYVHFLYELHLEVHKKLSRYAYNYVSKNNLYPYDEKVVFIKYCRKSMETNDTEIVTFQNFYTCIHLSTSTVAWCCHNTSARACMLWHTLQAATSYRQYLLIKLDLITPQYLYLIVSASTQ